MRVLYLFGVLVVMSGFSASAQHAVLSAGGDGSGPAGSFSFSVGQVAYVFGTSDTGSQSQGVQQAYPELEIQVGERVESVHMNLYPNPSRGQVMLDLPLEHVDWRAELTDGRGRLVQVFRPAGGCHPIDLSSVKSGVYHLRVFRASEYAGYFTVVRVD